MNRVIIRSDQAMAQWAGRGMRERKKESSTTNTGWAVCGQPVSGGESWVGGSGAAAGDRGGGAVFPGKEGSMPVHRQETGQTLGKFSGRVSPATVAGQAMTTKKPLPQGGGRGLAKHR